MKKSGSASYVPERGDVIWLRFDPQAGHEQAGRRPAVVLSLRQYNERAQLCLVAPITTKVKDYPFEVVLPSGLDVRGAVLSDQIKSLDWRAREAAFICALPGPPLKSVLQRAQLLLSGS